MNWKAIRIIFSFLGAYPYLLRPTVSLQVRYLLKEKLPFHAESDLHFENLISISKTLRLSQNLTRTRTGAYKYDPSGFVNYEMQTLINRISK